MHSETRGTTATMQCANSCTAGTREAGGARSSGVLAATRPTQTVHTRAAQLATAPLKTVAPGPALCPNSPQSTQHPISVQSRRHSPPVRAWPARPAA